MKLKKISTLVLLALLAFPLATFALTYSDGGAALPDPINDDFYTASETVYLNTPVNGDMMAAGGQVQINSPISQDLTLAGGNLSIQGEVGDDARLAGGDIRIDSIIKDDLIAGGGSITLSKNGFVGGDFVFGSGSTRIEGGINGNVLGATNELFINGEIKGNVRLLGVEKVTFGPNGKVLGDFSYRSPKPSADITPETVKGKIDHSSTEMPVDEKDFRAIAWGILSGFSIFGFLTLLFTGLFFLWAFRYFLVHAVDTADAKTMPSLGFGFLIAFVSPILALVLLATGIGLPLALIVFATWCLILFVGKLVAILIIGMRLVKTDEKSSFPRLYWAFVAGAFLYSALALIPILGWILRLLLSLLGIGALILVGTNLYQAERKKKII